MPVVYRQLPGYPILIFEIQGEYTVDHVSEIYRITADFKQDYLFVYRIVDLSGSESTYEQIYNILRLAIDSTVAGSYVEPGLMVILIRNPIWTRILRDVRQTPPFQGRPLPMFDTQAEAIDFAKQHYATLHSDD